MRIALSALLGVESRVIVGNISLPTSAKQDADEQSDSRRDTYCLPRPFARIAVSNLDCIAGSIGDRARHFFNKCPCRGDAGRKVGLGTGQIVTG